MKYIDIVKVKKRLTLVEYLHFRQPRATAQMVLATKNANPTITIVVWDINPGWSETWYQGVKSQIQAMINVKEMSHSTHNIGCLAI